MNRAFLVAGGVLVATLLGACSSGEARASYEEARATWEAQQVDDYSYRLVVGGCETSLAGDRVITVTDGRITAATSAEFGPLSTQRLEGLVTIDGFFDLLEESLDEGASSSMSFEESRGLPTSATIAWYPGVTDGTCTYTLTEFTPAPS